MRRYLVPFWSALPGVLAGAAVMYGAGAPAALWAQNILCLAVCGAAGALYLAKGSGAGQRAVDCMMGLALLLSCSPFFFGGTDGVHRWIRIGPVSVEVAFIAVPALLIGLYRSAEGGRSVSCYLLSWAMVVILFLQPDASMLGAFTAALLPLYRQVRGPRLLRYSWVLLLALACLAWVAPDPLEPVPYVEGIVAVAAQQGPVQLACCVVALIVMLVPFFAPRAGAPRRAVALGLGAFFFVLTASTLFGAFPVPLIGYGASPIAGHALATAYVTRHR